MRPRRQTPPPRWYDPDRRAAAAVTDVDWYDHAPEPEPEPEPAPIAEAPEPGPEPEPTTPAAAGPGAEALGRPGPLESTEGTAAPGPYRESSP